MRIHTMKESIFCLPSVLRRTGEGWRLMCVSDPIQSTSCRLLPALAHRAQAR